MKKILVSNVAFLFCFSLLAQNSVNLRMNLEKNKVYRLNSVSEQTVTQTINGNSQTSETKTDNTISLKMIDTTPSFMILEVRFDSLISNSNSMGKMIRINSSMPGDIKSSEATDVVACITNRLSKNALYVKMDFTGKVLEIVNLKMLSDLILKDTSSITLKNPVASLIKKQLENMVSDNTLKTMIEVYTYCLPGKEVSQGNDWNIALNTSAGGMFLDVITDYHLDRIADNKANLTAESNIKAPDNVEPMTMGTAKITYDNLKGLSKSTLVIDARTGLILEEKSKSHIAGDLGISAPGMSMQMPMDINGESTVMALK